MKRMPTIKSVMTPFPYSIEIDASLMTAQAMMEEHQIHHLPVSGNGRLVGIISKHDIETTLAADWRDRAPETLRIRDCYVSRIYVIALSEPLDAVLREMAERHIGSALVVKGEKLAGIFTATDAFREFAELLRMHYVPSPNGDDGGGDDDQAA
jgi:acetoin utilization protein AcuB